MNPFPSLEQQISQLENLLSTLQNSKTYQEKLNILNHLPTVQRDLENAKEIQTLLNDLTIEEQYAIKSIFAIGQGPIVFNMKNTGDDRRRDLSALLGHLRDLESFYHYMGGIIGYHLTLLKLILSGKRKNGFQSDEVRYIHPEGIDIVKDTEEGIRAIQWGIENVKNIAMIYPLGGAGERLNLKDEISGDPLPAALLLFLGYTLLEGLIRDLQAMEYLFFKLFHEQPVTPIAIMTSSEKNNHLHILNLCRSHHWFGRAQSSYYLFNQPSVPIITIDGNWSLSAPLTLSLKPCGHGAIWKLAEEQGVFNWLESCGRRQALVRQINNPIAGTDKMLFVLMGIGSHQGKAFGFASCERLLNSDEGINVLTETQHHQKYEYRLTNIEYTDFAKRGIHDVPQVPNSQYSTYPTNTNILYVNLPVVRKALLDCPIPGLIINFKSKVSYIDAKGEHSSVPGGRLESTMQNIADYIVDVFPYRLRKEDYREKLKTFIVYNNRSKTISTAKKSYAPGESSVSTPEQAYYDLLSNHYALLKMCEFELPEWVTVDRYLLEGPSCIFLFHPALGPLYSVIMQKLKKGTFAFGAELQLEIAEVDIEGLSVEGSLLIEAKVPLGTYHEGILHYGGESRCTLRNVTVCNRGIDRTTSRQYWKNQLTRQEAFKIILHEGAEFHAEGICFKGSHLFEVPPHHRMILHPQADGRWKEEVFPIENPTWRWEYFFDDQGRVKIRDSRNEKIHS